MTSQVAVQRQCPSRSSTARTIFGEIAVVRRPMATGMPSSSTRTGSMLALARNCSRRESAIGMPAISAGPCSGTCTCTTGRGANVGVSVPSLGSGRSHNPTSASAARCSKLSHA